jgi:hypothetical protein
MTTRLVRAVAWLYAGALVFIILGPASMRPETPMPLSLEHAVAFGLSGLSFSIGYRSHRLLLSLAGIGFAALLEFLQMWAPGRHARWIDFPQTSEAITNRCGQNSRKNKRSFGD